MGARFEALFMGVLTAVSNLGCIFFRILTSRLELCGPGKTTTKKPNPDGTANYAGAFFVHQGQNSDPKKLKKLRYFAKTQIQILKSSVLGGNFA